MVPDELGVPKSLKLCELEESRIRAVVDRNHYNQSAAARELGIQRMALVRKIQKYGIKNLRKEK